MGSKIIPASYGVSTFQGNLSKRQALVCCTSGLKVVGKKPRTCQSNTVWLAEIKLNLAVPAWAIHSQLVNLCEAIWSTHVHT